MYNKALFIDMLAKEFLLRSYKAAMQILAGIQFVLHSDMLVPAYVCMMRMRPADLNALVGGTGMHNTLNVDEWEEATLVSLAGGASQDAADAGSAALFDMLRDMTPWGRARVLRFWTGLHCLPGGGFRALEIPLRVVFDVDAVSNRGRLPTSQTCVMMLRVPLEDDKPTKKTLSEVFRVALAAVEFDDDDVEYY